jgi:hypothetical protein
LRGTRPATHLVAVFMLAALAVTAGAQSQYIGYVYPAGGQQGSTFQIRLGGQGLVYPSEAVVSGDGVSVRLIDHHRVMSNEELGLLRQQLNELAKKETTVDDALAAKMAWHEFPARVGPPEVSGLLCKACGRLNALDATACVSCNAPLEKPKDPAPAAAGATNGPPAGEKELAKKNLTERIQRLFAEDERDAAVPAHNELVFAEVTIEPDARLGRREIRVITKRGISTALPFYVDQVPEVARKPMKTAQKQVLGKEHLAQRKRPPEEETVHVTVPCTMNGQLAAGEVNRYRFPAAKGQRLLISAKARQLIPYVADGVPGWFQAVLRLHDAKGNEMAYNDDFRSDPDPVIHFEVPEDGEYILTVNEALFRGRESFVYRITIGELPFVTGIFPLGGRTGETARVEMNGWNLEGTSLTLPAADAKPGRHLVAATDGKLVSNPLPFVLDTLPECMEMPSNDVPAQAQKVTLPVIVNGRADHPGDWDVFEVDGRSNQTIVVEVHARRLGSPFDSFVKVTRADGKILALNDDHFDAASGLNTDHADSYLMVKLPADGKYHVHLGDTRRQAGKDFAYRLRISEPLPDFELRLVPSQIVLGSKGSASVNVHVIRKDGFAAPIALRFKELPQGFESAGGTVPADKPSAGLPIKTNLEEMEKPVSLVVLGTAKVGDREIVRDAVPCEDRMQAFLWRHLLPADTLPVLVCNRSYQPSADRIRPPIRDEDRPKDIKRTVMRSSVEGYLRQIERLYQEWFFTDEFTNGQIARIEASLIQ